MRKTLMAMLIVSIITVMGIVVVHAQATFIITPLTLSFGSSEPGIVFSGGFMAINALSWSAPDGTQLWTGDFGSTPKLEGAIDSALTKAGFAIVFGGGDANVDLGSTGALHATTLVVPINKPQRAAQISISAIRCADPTSADFSVRSCTAQIVDAPGNDRPWATSDGAHVYISYHDSKSSAIIRVQRSDDDGFTWKRVGDAITGAGPTTGSATHNNIAGPIVSPILLAITYMLCSPPARQAFSKLRPLILTTYLCPAVRMQASIGHPLPSTQDRC